MAASMLTVAVDEAWKSMNEGGIPVGAAMFRIDGTQLSRGHNMRIQDDDPSAHAEVVAFRNAGRLQRYRDTVLVSTCSPCWACAGIVRQFHIGYVVIGESINFVGAESWLAEMDTKVMNLQDGRCTDLLGRFISNFPGVWDEDIGRDL